MGRLSLVLAGFYSLLGLVVGVILFLTRSEWIPDNSVKSPPAHCPAAVGVRPLKLWK
jgi:hypothetical protein